jgi:hypothetical protein
MIVLIWFALAVLASPFKSKRRLEVENAVLRHQLIVLRRKVRGFCRYWFWKSSSRGGRPHIETELRALIRQTSVENQLWGAPHSR